jgi:hypothetical protein
MYRYNSHSSKNGVLLKSEIPVMPAYFIHKYPPGMSTFVSYVYLVTLGSHCLAVFIEYMRLLWKSENVVSVINVYAYKLY